MQPWRPFQVNGLAGRFRVKLRHVRETRPRVNGVNGVNGETGETGETGVCPMLYLRMHFYGVLCSLAIQRRLATQDSGFCEMSRLLEARSDAAG